MAERTLGDVPGIDALLPSKSAVLPSDYSVLDVDQYGDVTTPLGDVTSGSTGGDPFAVQFGFGDEPPTNTDSQERLAGEARDPSQASYSSDGAVPLSSTSGENFTDEQIQNAQTIAQVGKDVGASDRDIQVALMAAMVESNLTNLDHGDRDSVGLFQQRDAWGSFEDRTTPAKAARMFFEGGQGGQQGLLDIKDRDATPMGDLAQDVQVSAYPERYAEHQVDATLLFNQMNAPTRTPGPSANDRAWVGPYRPDELAQRAQRIAAAGTKDPYFNSVDDNYYRLCQHFVANLSGRESSGYGAASDAWSHFQATGTAHPATGADGNEPPVGAWLYYSGSSAAGHVAVYLGDGQVASTDVFGSGRAGVGPMKDLTDGAWHLNYLGWAAPWGKGDIHALPSKTVDPTWRDKVINEAKKYLGTPFKWGGKDYTGVDSDGFIANVYKTLGVKVPLHGLAYAADSIPVSSVKPGDLVAWDHGKGMGVYLGNDQYIEAGAPGRVVQLNSLGLNTLGAWGVPMESIIRKPTPDPFSQPARAPVTTNPGTVQATQIRPGTSVVEPHASITKPPEPEPSGVPITADDYQNKPRGPM